ncbi:hypothetical protein PMIN03_008330 [Paraphaeosphaeria minitans]
MFSSLFRDCILTPSAEQELLSFLFSKLLNMFACDCVPALVTVTVTVTATATAMAPDPAPAPALAAGGIDWTMVSAVARVGIFFASLVMAWAAWIAGVVARRNVR